MGNDQVAQAFTMTVAMLSTAVGVLVVIGWVGDITTLKGIMPHWVTMKVSTAICFILTGLMLGCMVKSRWGGSGLLKHITPTIGLLLLGIMGFNATLWLLGINSGFGTVFTIDDPLALYTSTPGRPSIPTMLSFLLIGITGFITYFTEGELFRWMLRITGTTIAVFGAIAVAGYLTANPALYYATLHKGSAMALHTAVLFVLIGIASWFLSADTHAQQLN